MPSAASRSASPAESDAVPEEYDVERIDDERGHGSKKVYFVKWKGYSRDDNTWEPAEGLTGCPDILRDWKKKRAAKAGTPKTPTKTPTKGDKSASRGRSGDLRRSGEREPEKVRNGVETPRKRRTQTPGDEPMVHRKVVESLPRSHSGTPANPEAIVAKNLQKPASKKRPRKESPAPPVLKHRRSQSGDAAPAAEAVVEADEREDDRRSLSSRAVEGSPEFLHGVTSRRSPADDARDEPQINGKPKEPARTGKEHRTSPKPSTSKAVDRSVLPPVQRKAPGQKKRLDPRSSSGKPSGEQFTKHRPVSSSSSPENDRVYYDQNGTADGKDESPERTEPVPIARSPAKVKGSIFKRPQSSRPSSHKAAIKFSKKGAECRDRGVQTEHIDDDPLTCPIPQELQRDSDYIERLRQKSQLAIRIQGLIPMDKSKPKDTDDVYVAIVFDDKHNGEAVEIFTKRVVRFVLPLLLIEFYEGHLDLPVSSTRYAKEASVEIEPA